MKNLENLFNYIVTEIKEMEKGSMIYLIIFSIIFALIDISHLFLHFHFPEYLRIFYFYAYVLSSTYYVNKVCKIRRLKKEAEIFKQNQEQEIKKQNEEYLMQIIDTVKIIKPVLNSLSMYQLGILKTFIKEQSLTVTLTNNPITDVNIINMKLMQLNLKIDIKANFPYLIIQIDKLFYDLLSVYFSLRD